MNEEQWLGCNDSQTMLEFLRGKASDRKFRLATCACVRLGAWVSLPAESRQAVEARENHADGLLGPGELHAAQLAAWGTLMEACRGGSPAPDPLRAAAEVVGQPYPSPMQRAVASGNLHDWMVDADARWADETERWAVRTLEFAARAVQIIEEETPEAAETVQCRVLFCVFGNPFRPPAAVDSSWLSWGGGTIPKLAQAAYEHRDPSAGTLDSARLAVLADALEEVGADAGLIAHLRDPGPHWRGCHALDAILGKE